MLYLEGFPDKNKVNKFSRLCETKERKKIVNLPDKYY